MMRRSSKYTVSGIPTIKFSRSQFDLSHGHKTSASMGILYPLDPIEVLPGDTFKGTFNLVARLASSFVKPIMDNIFIDVYHFFVPSRILYDKFVNIFGENTESAWANSEDYEIPMLEDGSNSDTSNYTLSSSQSGYNAQVGCHFGLPLGQNLNNDESNFLNVSLLPFRAFAMIYDDFFRDQNNISPMNINKGDTLDFETLNSDAWSPQNYTGLCPRVAKMHDYFTSSLPSPQKGDAVDIPLSLLSPIPVVTSTDTHAVSNQPLTGVIDGVTGSSFVNLTGQRVASGSNNFRVTGGVNGADTSATAGFTPNNLVVEPGTYSTDITVNELRLAFQTQKMLERDARCGSRYVEYLLGHWGVSSGDSRLQRPEFLGGRRIPINIQQVAQTTGFTASNQPNTLAQLGAYSLSGGSTRFTKSFVEHGYIISCFCIRQFHSYQQGISKLWQRKKRTDFYEPVISNIGEQPVWQNQLFADVSTNSVGDNGSKPIFGYQEAWAEYRQLHNVVSGQMHFKANDSLSFWHLGDEYNNAPILGQQFIEEGVDNLDRVITVGSQDQDQFILDFWEDIKAVREMPTYSEPKFIDHN